jgi:hypothetical protein
MGYEKLRNLPVKWCAGRTLQKDFSELTWFLGTGWKAWATNLKNCPGQSRFDDARPYLNHDGRNAGSG